MDSAADFTFFSPLRYTGVISTKGWMGNQQIADWQATLIIENEDEYEALALNLACNPDRLLEIKATLARNRDTHPLFDTSRFTRHLESGYQMMWERLQMGEKPQTFAVAPILPSLMSRGLDQ